jgi:mono/diheme cytochrome c family protein
LISRKQPGRRVRLRAAAGLVALGAATLSGCTDAAGYDLDYILGQARVVSTMRTTVAYESQTLPRLPVAGTIPVSSPIGEVLPAFGQAQLDSAAATLTNTVPATPEVLARGQLLYANQCAVCHGTNGEGNGPVVGIGRFPLGPAVNDGLAAGRSDGYLYGVIRVGRGLMPAYGARITHNDRWAVVHYLRQIQGTAGTAPQPAAVAAPPVEMQQSTTPGQQ